MFTGIIECMGALHRLSSEGSNKSFWISAPFNDELKVDQSVAHNGVCLTVEAIEDKKYKVTAIAETLEKTTLQTWREGDRINLERCLLPTSRLDGHFVQGHVDCQAVVLTKKDMNGSWLFTIQFPSAFAPLVIEKGSVSVNGVSLTAFNVKMTQFDVAIIPYTYKNTNLQFIASNDQVNLEFDLLGKYLLRLQETRNQ